jgi:hypothetical protein
MVLIVQFAWLGKPDERSRTIYRYVLSAMFVTCLFSQGVALIFTGPSYTPEFGVTVLVIPFIIGNAVNFYVQKRRFL